MINHSQLPRETHQKVYWQTLEAGGDWAPPNPSQLSDTRFAWLETVISEMECIMMDFVRYPKCKMC